MTKQKSSEKDSSYADAHPAAAAIREFRAKLQCNQRDFAKLVGVTPGAVAQWETGRTKPSAMALMAIGKVGGADKMFWFRLAGRWNAEIEEGIDAFKSRHPGWHPDFIDTDNPLAEIPLVNGMAASGTGRVNESEATEAILLLPRSLFQNPSATKCIWFEGESMLPTIPVRTIGAVDRSQRDMAKLAGKIVAAYHETSGLVIKRLVVTVEGKNRLVSDNPAHPNFEFEKGWRIVGRVVWWLQTV